MTNIEQLKQIKSDYNLTHGDIAKILGASLQTVSSYFLKDGSPGKRNLSDLKLDYLKIKLKNRRKAPK